MSEGTSEGMGEGMSERGRLGSARREEIDARAREWMSCLYSGELTERQEAGFRRWLAESPEHRDAFQSLDELWRSLDRIAHIDDVLVEVTRDTAIVPAIVPAIIPGPPRWRAVLQANFRIAAAVVVAVAAVVALATLQSRQRAEPLQLATEVGEVRTLDLTDGSQLVLRPDTAILAAMSDDERNITIERGGAYFDVSRDEARPFVVSAGAVDVRVHGTAFDVLKGPSSITVSVTHGHVTVSDLDENKRNRVRKVELIAGQQITVQADGTFGAVVAFDSQRVLGWRDGRFSYLNARLEDIVADLNRYRTEKIVIEDQTLGDLRITTAFRAENADQMLAGIAATEPVSIVRSSSSITIRRR